MPKEVLVGIDEAGRGALGGPVVAGACVLTDALKKHPLIRDSKQLKPEQRDEAYEWITANCIYGIGIVDASFIDTNGILAATEKAMQEAVAQIAEVITPTFLLVDGRDKFWFNYPHTSIIKGDQKEPCIAAASIMAKVTRDRLMIKEHNKFPAYNFAQHKAYGTAMHRKAIEQHGACTLHRHTFLGNITHTIK